MPNWAKIVILIAACLITFPSDWSTIAMICPFYLYQHRGKFRLQTRDIVILIAVYAAVYFLFLDKLYGVLQMFTFLTIPILAGYNGERGRWKGMKWLFLHLLSGASCCDWGSPTCAGWQCADYFLTFAGTYWFGQKDMLMHGFIGFTHKWIPQNGFRHWKHQRSCFPTNRACHYMRYITVPENEEIVRLII